MNNFDPHIAAEMLRRMGQSEAPGDTVLAHITPAEARLLQRYGGSGRVDPQTQAPHFDEGSGENGDNDSGSGYSSTADDSTTSGDDGYQNSFDDGSMANAMNGTSVDNSVTANDPNVESSGVMAGTTGTAPGVSAAGGRSGQLSDAAIAAANAEYAGVYGDKDDAGNPATTAEALNDAYNSYASDFNNAGKAGQVFGTLWDTVRGAYNGLSQGPVGALAGGIYGGVHGKSGDLAGQWGRDSVAQSLMNGTWNSRTGEPGESVGDSEPIQYYSDAGGSGGTGVPVKKASWGNSSSSAFTFPGFGKTELGSNAYSTALGKALASYSSGESQDMGPLTSGLLRRQPL